MLLLIQKIVILQKIFHIYLFLSVNWLKICGVQVPAAEALITLANLYNDVDYRKTGRTLEKIGFNHWTKQEILEFLQI